MCLPGGKTKVTQQAAKLTPDQEEVIRLMLQMLSVRSALTEPLLQQLGFSLTNAPGATTVPLPGGPSSGHVPLPGPTEPSPQGGDPAFPTQPPTGLPSGGQNIQLFRLPPSPQQTILDQLRDNSLNSMVGAQRQMQAQAGQYPDELARLLALTRSLQPTGLQR